MSAAPRAALVSALVLVGCVTPAQRAELMLKAFDEKCLDLEASTLERVKSLEEVLPRGVGVLKVSGHGWRRDPTQAAHLLNLRCELEGTGVDEALLARGLLARLQPPRDLHWRDPSRPAWSTTWPLDPSTRGAVATLSRSFGKTHLSVTAYELGNSRVTRSASSLREHLASWRELPGADEAYAWRFDKLVEANEAEARLLAKDLAIARENRARYDAERAEARRQIISSAVGSAIGAAARTARDVRQVEADTARIAARSGSSGSGYVSSSAGTSYSGRGSWVPPAGARPASASRPASKTKPVCRWGEARACPNGFKVGAVEYDCKPGGKAQAEASYKKQLAQCEEPAKATSGDVAQCFRERTTCQNECEKQEACEAPPRPASQEYLGPEPHQTEQGLWVVLQTDGVTTKDQLGWLPGRQLAERLAVSNARTEAGVECRARFEAEHKPTLHPDITVFPAECESKVEMGTTVWNCKVVVKATCHWERPSAVHAAWLEKKARVELSEKEREALQATFEQCKAAQKQASQTCKARCQRCQ